MGTVWRASTLADRTPLAVKILRPELSADPEAVTRFVRERSILTSLRHPHLVQVRDLVVEGETLAIVMDLVGGGDLRRRLAAEGTLAPGPACALLSQVLGGLTVIHQAGVAHRDLKPENVLLDSGGSAQPVAKLSDFGVARIVHGQSLTRLTGLIGTPEYMAPELAEREHGGPEADIYAAGILLYELLLGRTPFSGGHPVAVLRRHLEQPPHLPPSVPDELRELLAVLLAKQPPARPTAADAGADLAGLASELAALPALDPLPATGPEAGAAEGQGDGYPEDGDARSTRMGRRHAVRSGGPPSDPAATGRRRPNPFRRAGRAPVLACALLVVALAVGAVAWPRRSTPAPPAELALTPAVHADGLLVTGTWRLDGRRGDRLQASLRILNSTRRPVTGSVDEVIPKSLAASVDAIRFTPPPDRIVQRDPVVRYAVTNLGPGASREVTYAIDVAPAGPRPARLRTWASDRSKAVAALAATGGADVPTTLTALRIAPGDLTLTPSQRYSLRVAGRMSDRSAAPRLALGGVLWSSSDPSVVTVEGGRLLAYQPGTATVTAQAGAVEDRATVTVTAAVTAAGPVGAGAGGAGAVGDASATGGAAAGAGAPSGARRRTSTTGAGGSRTPPVPKVPRPPDPTPRAKPPAPPATPTPTPPPPPRGFETTPDFTYFPTCGRPCWLPLRAQADYRSPRVTNGWPLEGRDRVWVECQTRGNDVLSQGTLQDSRGVRSNIWNKIRGSGWGNDIWLGNRGWRGIPC
jgi:hypothetical protein